MTALRAGAHFLTMDGTIGLTLEARGTKLAAHQELQLVMKRPRAVVFALACVFAAGPAQAFDPLSLIVLRMIRDHIASAQLEAALTPGDKQRARPVGSPRQYPRDLEMLVNEGFPQLDAAQRKAVRDRLTEIMNDPHHAAQRDEILSQFVQGTSAARRTHEALAHLTDAQKRTIAAQAAAAYRDKEPEALQHAMDMLRSDAMPIPLDLRELMLAEFRAESARSR